MCVCGGGALGRGTIVHLKTHEEKSSDQLRPPSELGPRGERAVLSGRLVAS